MSYKPNMPPYPEYELYDKVYLKKDTEQPFWITGFEPYFGYNSGIEWKYHIARPHHSKHPPERWTGRENMSTGLVYSDDLYTENDRNALVKEQLRLKIADTQAELDRLLALEAVTV